MALWTLHQMMAARVTHPAFILGYLYVVVQQDFVTSIAYHLLSYPDKYVSFVVASDGLNEDIPCESDNTADTRRP